MLKCDCGEVISEERIRSIMSITGQAPATCCKCSTVKRKKALMQYLHKTAGEIVMIPQNNPEAERQAFRAYHRAR